MIYIKLFRELKKNILPKNDRILRLGKQPGQAGTKKVLGLSGKFQIPNPKFQTMGCPSDRF
jgi:hypothetical protein